ncbi:MAG: riboflavin kinase [Candidatus Gracilibacteria bacterium]|nr:riboflavin kinase [Candidatus Gracilibacteria bacterium]
MFTYFKYSLLISPVFFLTYLVRFNLGPIPTNLLEVLVGIFFLIWLYGIWKLKFPKPQFANRWQWSAPLVFLVASTIAVAWTLTQLETQHMLVPLGIWKGWFIAPACYYLMLISTFKKKQDWWQLFEVSLGIAGLTAAVLILQYFTGWFSDITSTYDLRLVWPYLDPWTGLGASGNYPALFLAPFFCMGFNNLVYSPLSDTKLKKGWVDKSYGTLIVLALGVAIYLSKSYGSWIAIIGTCSLLSFLQTTGRKRWVTIPLLTVLAVGLLYFDQKNSEKFIFATNTEEVSEQTIGSGEERRNIWATSWDLLVDSPIFGVGIGQFQRSYEVKAPITLSREVSRKEINHALHPHNTFLMFWLSTGFFGLLSFLYLLGVWGIPAPKDLRYLLWAPFIYLMAHGLIEVVYWKNDLAYSFWFFGALLALAQNFNLVSGRVEHGLKIGKELGFPTANMSLDLGLELDYGVYTVNVRVGKHKKKGLLYFGPRMTQGLPENEVCEITIFDFDEDLYGQKVTFKIGSFVRGPMKFDSKKELKEQIQKDVLVARNRK